MPKKSVLMVKKKILIAAGGTGGHLFPAQALARELLEKGDYEVKFCASGLASNRCFSKEMFSYFEITSATPFKKKIASCFLALFSLIKGGFESVRILTRYKPDLIVGFGSFHTAPVLFGAVLTRVPFILYESNSFPGKVNRLFSKWAKVSSISFKSAEKHLLGKIEITEMPLWKRQMHKKLSKEEAREYFGLKPDVMTLLVFGGSQGAFSINSQFSKAAELLKKTCTYQVIHLIGKKENLENMKQHYASISINACVKEFEEMMSIAWQAADLAICRSGAATIFEQVLFEIPAIFIPYPFASEKHQQENARFIVEDVKGGKMLLEEDLTVQKLSSLISACLDPEKQELKSMKNALLAFKEQTPKKTLFSLVEENL